MSAQDKQLGFATVAGDDGRTILRYDGWAEKLEKEITLILLPKLDSKFSQDECRRLAARLAMLAGDVRAAIDGALLGVATLALQEELEPFAAAEAADGTTVTSHVDSLFSNPLA